MNIPSLQRRQLRYSYVPSPPQTGNKILEEMGSRKGQQGRNGLVSYSVGVYRSVLCDLRASSFRITDNLGRPAFFFFEEREAREIKEDQGTG